MTATEISGQHVIVENVEQKILASVDDATVVVAGDAVEQIHITTQLATYVDVVSQENFFSLGNTEELIALGVTNDPVTVEHSETGVQGPPGVGLPGPIGLVGPPGPPGPPGTGGDATYRHQQVMAASTWTINHPLNKYPSVQIVDSGGTVWVGDINYISTSQVIVSFTTEFGGEAFLN